MLSKQIPDATQDDILEQQLAGLFSDIPATTVIPPRPHPRTWLHLPTWRTRLGSVAILALVVASMLVNRGRAAQSSAIATVVDARVFPTTYESLPGAMPTASAVFSHSSRHSSATVNTPNIPTSAGAAAIPAASATPALVTKPLPTASATLARARRVYPATATPALGLGSIPIPTPVPLVPMPDKAINIALLGSDRRPYETQWRTDVVIIVSVNPDLPSVSMLSIPRDTWLYIPNWAYQRINLADTHGEAVGYPGGGPGLIKAAIEYNFGIHVDYYARVDFAGLIRIVDTLDGVDVLLDCPVEDGFPDDPITEDPSVVTQISYPEPGLYHLDGKHALWLARSRQTTSEFARSRRQHRILRAIWVKANQLGLIASLPELWEELTTTVQTDLSLDNVLWLASVGLKLQPAQIHSGFLDGRYLSAWTSPGGASVLLPHTEAILEALEPLFNPYSLKAPQGFSQVEVWNGSGHENWGLLAADKLLRNGFEVVNIQLAGTLYEESVILDFTSSSKGSPLPLLQSLFDATAAHVAAETRTGDQAPFRLIVGADYQPCERPTTAQRAPTSTPSATED